MIRIFSRYGIPKAVRAQPAIKHIRLLGTRAAPLDAVIDGVIDFAADWSRLDFRDFPILRKSPTGPDAALNVVREAG